MKILFTNHESRFARRNCPTGQTRVFNRQSSIVHRNSQGIALVITLVLLSVITFMTIAFLVLSRRERGSVSTVTDANTAKFAADTAFERAKAELIAPILAMTNDQQFDLLVSTNFINRNGFDPNATDGRTNVNYDFLTLAAGGGALSSAQFQQNLTNLYYNPRPPVFVSTNSASPNDFRFYLDMNRNGRFDTNGYLPVLSPDPLNPYYTTNNVGDLVTVPANYAGWILSNNFVGDPEWIGVLEFPDRPHGPNNRFLARYAYIVLPIGKTLDVNYMHNQAATRALNAGNDGYLRNQGVGTWELNLAAFLTDLNTNVWNPQINPYLYRRVGGGLNNQGLAFEDSLALLAYRYNYNYANLTSASALFPGGAALFVNDNIDEYSDGVTMTGNSIDETLQVDQVGEKWAGSDNTNHFFTTQDFFDRSKILPAVGGFVDRLQNAGTSNDTYNAYTYYRMLAQLGMDSEPDNRINVNYRNVSNNVIVPGMETNLIAWQPLEFFTNAANAMLGQISNSVGYPLSVTNIPLFPVNYYTPAVHRILQQAANIYDATTNRFIGAGPTNYPSVFRPYFRTETINGTNWAFIAGYVEETTTINATDGINLAYVDLGDFASNNAVNPRLNINIHGIPWVIGAKKGFPNFNAFAMKNALNVARKLDFTNYNAATQTGITNQMFLFNVTNTFGVEAWNSYTNTYRRSLRLVVTNEVSIVIRTNQTLGVPFLSITNIPFGTALNYSQWTNWVVNSASGNSFQIPLYQSFMITNGIYSYDPSLGWRVYAVVPPIWGGISTPQLWVNLSVRLRYWLIDTSVDRIVDYVNVVGQQAPVDVLGLFSAGSSTSYPADMWDTNLFRGLPAGIYRQIRAGIGDATVNSGGWSDPDRSACFKYHLGITATKGADCSLTNYFQDPFTPTRTAFQTILWAANDPLVHYTAGDLSDLFTSSQNSVQVDSVTQDPLTIFVNPSKRLPDHFRPWNGNINGSADTVPSTARDLTVKDPLVSKSDDWDFPTNKLPNVGWLGRVHRGTPWQTVYMKSYMDSGIFTNFTTWKKWSGNTNQWYVGTNTFVNDASYSFPANDYRLFDLFTTAPNANASRGRLNINQTNLAAWSAVLSGVLVITNQPGTNLLGWKTIEPAGIYTITNPPELVQIWTNINATRANLNPTNRLVFAGQSFHSVGDILAAPALTTASPFLTNAMPWLLAGGPNRSGISDAVMERIPQQIMSLLSLSHEPRFVVYSFGQTLHPAEHSLVTGGQLNGLCTNYQITAETATRAVVRAEPFAVTNGNSISTNYNVVVEQYNVLPPD